MNVDTSNDTDLSNIGVTEDQLVARIETRRAERTEAALRLRDIDEAIEALEARLNLARTSRLNNAQRLRAIERLRKTAERHERRRVKEGRSLPERHCEHDGCTRTPAFYVDDFAWCKRHVPADLRPHGKIT